MCRQLYALEFVLVWWGLLKIRRLGQKGQSTSSVSTQQLQFLSRLRKLQLVIASNISSCSEKRWSPLRVFCWRQENRQFPVSTTRRETDCFSPFVSTPSHKPRFFSRIFNRLLESEERTWVQLQRKGREGGVNSKEQFSEMNVSSATHKFGLRGGLNANQAGPDVLSRMVRFTVETMGVTHTG